MEFVVCLYRKQVEEGRIFVYGTLAHAKYWVLPSIRNMVRTVGVEVVEADQCMFGVKACGRHRSQVALAQGPTIILANGMAIGRTFSNKCDPHSNTSRSWMVEPIMLRDTHQPYAGRSAAGSHRR